MVVCVHTLTFCFFYFSEKNTVEDGQDDGLHITRLSVQNMADAFSTPSTQHPLQNYILKTFGLFLIHRNSTTMFQNMADAFFIGHFLDDHPKYGRT